MRLISWNVDLFRSGTRGVEKKVEAVCQYSPDIVAFQEVTDRALPLFREELENYGLFYSVDSLALVEIARVAYMAERLNELRARGANDPFQFAYGVSRLSDRYSPAGEAKDFGCLIAKSARLRYPVEAAGGLRRRQRAHGRVRGPQRPCAHGDRRSEE